MSRTHDWMSFRQSFTLAGYNQLKWMIAKSAFPESNAAKTMTEWVNDFKFECHSISRIECCQNNDWTSEWLQLSQVTSSSNVIPFPESNAAKTVSMTEWLNDFKIKVQLQSSSSSNVIPFPKFENRMLPKQWLNEWMTERLQRLQVRMSFHFQNRMLSKQWLNDFKFEYHSISRIECCQKWQNNEWLNDFKFNFNYWTKSKVDLDWLIDLV